MFVITVSATARPIPISQPVADPAGAIPTFETGPRPVGCAMFVIVHTRRRDSTNHFPQLTYLNSYLRS